MNILSGLIFIIAGVISAIVFVAAGAQSGEILFMFVGCLMGLIFIAVGAYLVVKQAADITVKNRILREGSTLTGKIIDYRDGDGVIVNGVPPLDLVVEADYMGETRQFIVPSGGYKEKDYPIGAYVDFAVLGVETAVIKGTVRF
jgi:hypothetical protein